MEKGKFKLADIKIGDMVFFSIRGGGNNHQSYWTVMSKDKDGKIRVKMDGNGNDKDMLIDIKDVQVLHPVPSTE